MISNKLTDQNALEENLSTSLPSSSSEKNFNEFDQDQFYTVTSLDKNKFLEYIKETNKSPRTEATVSNSIPIKVSPYANKEQTKSIHSSNASLDSSTNSMNDSKLSRNPSSAYLKKLINENSPNVKTNDSSPSKMPSQEGVASNTSSLIGFSTSFLNTNEPELKEYSGSSISSHDDQNESIDINQENTSSSSPKLKDIQEKKSSPVNGANLTKTTPEASSQRNSSLSPQSNYYYDDAEKNTSSLRQTPNSASKKIPNNSTSTQAKNLTSNNVDKEKRKPWYSVSKIQNI